MSAAPSVSGTLKTPVLLVGAGALGSAILQGWRRTGAVAPKDVMILDLHPGEEANRYAADGARLNPGPESWGEARTIVMAVKPHHWREAAQILTFSLSPAAVIVSVMAGVRTEDLAKTFDPNPVARVMPTTGVATGQGVATLYSASDTAFAAALALFGPIATTVRVADEGEIDAATAISGSGPAYVYAFTAALEAAALKLDLSPEDARTLARATVISAARMMEETGRDPEDLIRQVASPGGTTEAALKVLRGAGQSLNVLVETAARAAHNRAKELG
ncbi:MAG: pyrroline-5-carboxylate reductase family protein [Asticcacaulis sp.]